MPNNVYTEVKIQGEPYLIDAMYGKLRQIEDPKAKEGFGFLETFVGDPTKGMTDEQKSAQVVSEGFPVKMSRWYRDRLEAWGTKWDIYDVTVQSVDFVPTHGGFEASRILKCTWHTAWSPCVEALLTMSNAHNVDFQIRYIDECLNYVGTCTIIDGEVNKEANYESEDVYQGLYEVFGADHLISYCECMEPDYVKTSVLKQAKQFADKKTLKRLKEIIKSSQTT